MSEAKRTTLVTKYPGLRIVVSPEKPLRNAVGQTIRHYQPIAVEFTDPDIPEGSPNAKATAVLEERVRQETRLIDHEDGDVITKVETKVDVHEIFVNGSRLQDPSLTGPDERFWTYEDLLDYLRNKPTFNVDFWELGNAPDEPKPTLAERQAEIATATAAGDPEALHRIRDDEQATHGRPDVLTAVQAAFDAVAKTPEQSQGADPVRDGADGGDPS